MQLVFEYFVLDLQITKKHDPKKKKKDPNSLAEAQNTISGATTNAQPESQQQQQQQPTEPADEPKWVVQELKKRN